MLDLVYLSGTVLILDFKNLFGTLSLHVSVRDMVMRNINNNWMIRYIPILQICRVKVMNTREY